MGHRLRGTLDSLTDEEGRSLRPIGMTVREAADRTGVLLDRLTDHPGVRLYAGVRVAKHAPRLGFAISTASHLLLVESVAWPSGSYTVTPGGCVLCDGTYIGQSVLPLLASVRLMRRVVRRLTVGAVVVVHPSGHDRPALPVGIGSVGIGWIPPSKLCSHVSQRLLLRRRAISCHGDTNSWYRQLHR
jgi:hypothetical protein